jgi:rod shape-determining protein MreD
MVFEPQSPDLLRPVKPGFVALTLGGAFLFNQLPWRDLRGVPDLVGLVLLFWCIHQPRLIGFAIPFICGLVMDAANGVLLGQHALAYSVLAFAGQAVSRRMPWFSAWRQAIQVLVVLVLVQAITVGIRLAAGGTFPGWAYFSGGLIAALLWPLATFVLLAPQRAAANDDGTTL